MLERLQHATNELYASESVQESTSITVETAIDILGFDWCVVTRADHDSGVFEVVATAGDTRLEVGDRPLGIEEGVVGEVYGTGEPRMVDDVAASDHGDPIDERIESAVTVPIGDWGVFQALGTAAGRFDTREQQLAELLVTPLATTIERIRTERQLREQKQALERQNDQIEALHAVTTEMKSATTRDRVYELCIEAVEEVLGIEVCTLDERDGDVLKTKAVGSQMELADYYDETPVDQPGSVATETYDRGETILVDDLDDTSYRAANSEYRSGISVPLGDWGVFQAATEEAGAFDETDRRLIELLADATVAAVDRIERKRELEARAEKLERQNERLDQFTRVVSHDIRTPLSVAVGYLQQARTERDSPELAKVADALDRMDALVDDTLALARGGDAVIEPDPVAIADVARAQWRDVATDEASLETDRDAIVLADESRLGRVFENLFRNAIEHAGEDVTVTVDSFDEGFAVQDDGPGIDADRPFEHGHSGADGGTGLGLAIVREIVEAHGWEIAATQGEGENGGARFEITGVERADQQ
jgi:signal transduction histidine kinase